MEQLNKQISDNASKLAASTKSSKYVFVCSNMHFYRASSYKAHTDNVKIVFVWASMLFQWNYSYTVNFHTTHSMTL